MVVVSAERPVVGGVGSEEDGGRVWRVELEDRRDWRWDGREDRVRTLSNEWVWFIWDSVGGIPDHLR